VLVLRLDLGPAFVSASTCSVTNSSAFLPSSSDLHSRVRLLLAFCRAMRVLVAGVSVFFESALLLDSIHIGKAATCCHTTAPARPTFLHGRNRTFSDQTGTKRCKSNMNLQSRTDNDCMVHESQRLQTAEPAKAIGDGSRSKTFRVFSTFRQKLRAASTRCRAWRTCRHTHVVRGQSFLGFK
jgi:hypothetical protein